MLEVFEEIVAGTHRDAGSEDYFVDGLLYCGKCRTPRQIRFEAVGRIHEPYIPCQCELEQERKIKEQHRNVCRFPLFSKNLSRQTCIR